MLCCLFSKNCLFTNRSWSLTGRLRPTVPLVIKGHYFASPWSKYFNTSVTSWKCSWTFDSSNFEIWSISTWSNWHFSIAPKIFWPWYKNCQTYSITLPINFRCGLLRGWVVYYFLSAMKTTTSTNFSSTPCKHPRSCTSFPLHQIV